MQAAASISWVDTAAFCFDDSVRELLYSCAAGSRRASAWAIGLAVVAGRGGGSQVFVRWITPGSVTLTDVQRRVVNLGGAGVVGGRLRSVKLQSQQLPAFCGSTAPSQRELCGIVGLRGAMAFSLPGPTPGRRPHCSTGLPLTDPNRCTSTSRSPACTCWPTVRHKNRFPSMAVTSAALPRTVRSGSAEGLWLVLSLGTFHKRAATR